MSYPYRGGSRSAKDSFDRATAYEAAVLRQGHGAICTHDHTADLDRRTTSQADLNAAQEAGQKACKAAQLAALEAKVE
jgi:hypothetical protein